MKLRDDWQILRLAIGNTIEAQKNIMRFLPFETIVIETVLGTEDVISNLKSNMESINMFRSPMRSDFRGFKGYFFGNEFEISRLGPFSFVVARGRIEAFDTGTRITVKIRLNDLRALFMAGWFGVVGLFAIVALNSEDSSEIKYFLPMLLLGYVLIMGGYLYDSYETKELLTEITKGQIISDDN